MTTIKETVLRQLGDAGSRLAVSVARDEHVLRRVEGSNREGEWLCSCGVGFPVPGDARDRAQIEHSAHLWSTVREACEAQGFTLSTAWMAGAKKAEAALVDARLADTPISATDPIDYSLIALRRLSREAHGKLDRIVADSPNDHRSREVTSAHVCSLKKAISVVEGSRKAVAVAPRGANVLVVDGGPGMPKRTFVEVGGDIAAMTDRQLSNMLHGRDKDNNGEFTASSMGAAQDDLPDLKTLTPPTFGEPNPKIVMKPKTRIVDLDGPRDVTKKDQTTKPEMSEADQRRYAGDVADWINRQLTEARTYGQPESGDWRSLVQNIDLIVTALRAYSSPPNKGNALTDCGPDFRVVPVRVLKGAHGLIDGLGTLDEEQNGILIEIGHLINERQP